MNPKKLMEEEEKKLQEEEEVSKDAEYDRDQDIILEAEELLKGPPINDVQKLSAFWTPSPLVCI